MADFVADSPVELSPDDPHGVRAEISPSWAV
jgi:hypothetical protein